MHVLRIHPGYAAAVCAFAVDGVYLALVHGQGNGGARVAFVACSLALAGLAAAAAERGVSPAAGCAAAWAVGTLWIWTVLGMLSIGILVVPAGIFATIALDQRRAHPAVIVAGIALALLLAAAGLAWTPG
jgi:hypothetical protein